MGNNGKDKIKVCTVGEFAAMLGVLDARSLRLSFADKTHGASETVLRPDDPRSSRCSAFARAFAPGDFLVRGISASNFFGADREPKKSSSSPYATPTISKRLGHFVCQRSKLAFCFKRTIPATIRLNYLVWCAKFGESYLQVVTEHLGGPVTTA
jgi:hypothetical protein